MLVLLALACPDSTKESNLVNDSATTETRPTDSPTGTACTPSVRAYNDVDGDGYGDASTEHLVCRIGEGEVRDDRDCDDLRASINPGLPEDCETWADDDCRDGNGNNGCEGHGWRTYYGQFDWDDVESATASGLGGTKVVGVYGLLVCDVGGTLIASPSPAPSCPECAWTFHADATLADPWLSGPCDDLVDGMSLGTGSLGDYTWGFTYTDPATSVPGPGWLLVYDDYPPEWLLWAGPGQDDIEYSMSTDGVHTSFYWTSTVYESDFYYTYWRYGEPTRAYNP